MYFADLANVTSNATLIFGVVAAMTAVVLGFFSAKQKVSVVSLEESERALKALNETLRLQVDSYTKENILLRQKASVLENEITQAPQINELALQLGTQHKEMMQAMAVMSNGNSKMTKEIGNIAKALSKDAHVK